MVRLPSLRGVIDRRILVNFRIEADALDAVLPDPFEPRTVDGYAIGGICLLRLTDVRPRGLPAFVGTRSENAAHRVGVEWADDGKRESGVYVPRRDSSSRLTAAVGRRSFGEYYRADFDVDERDGRYAVSMRSRDGETRMSVTASVADGIPADSVFDSVEEASAYHRRGAVGYSPAAGGAGDRFDGVELATDEWRVTPLSVEDVSASFFEDERRFPADAVTFDNALLMRDIGHEWRDVGSICPEPEAAADGSSAATAQSTV
ncbi:DUF2071 domain-containing protein [Halosimplex aquaticum]|uniref:DUF2071 domain-containing protein n=1 Tax=Halosimplex aquaticum TaxID=3026162 RepID=A0ABD5XW62_9EURY|nr:DUF2071 domain-containing protein [Halosimplex aquaticum]